MKIASTHPKPVERTPASSPRSAAATAPAGKLDEHLVSLRSPASFEAEQYHVLRHDLEQLRRSRGLAVFAITSPAHGDGKTTTAINLAGSLAQDPAARVLLVDADLRHPSVGESLGVGPSGGPGLAAAILDPGSELDAVVQRRGASNLAILPAGWCPVVPYEVLQSPRVGELLEAARQAYDYVLLDTPPLLLVPDCRLVAKWVDAFVMVVAAHRTPRKLLEEALNLMDPGKLVGLVFNNDDRPFSAYHGYYYHRSRESTGGPRRSWWRSLWGGGRPRPSPEGEEGGW